MTEPNSTLTGFSLMTTSLYCFSGTGNSLKIAKDLGNLLPETRLVRVCSSTLSVTQESGSERIGFVFPVYYRGLPHMLADFIRQLAVPSGTYVFSVATYGSYAAIAHDQIDRLLRGKGARLSGRFGVPMPGNMWFMYYPHPQKDFTERIARQPDLTRRIAHLVLQHTLSAEDIPANYAEEAAMYRDFHPREKGRLLHAEEGCISCGTCARLCPAENILLRDGRPTWLQRCEFCLACLHWCPAEAIQFDHDSQGKERYHHPEILPEELMRR